MPTNTIAQPYVADMPGVLDAWRNRNRQQAQDARYERQIGLQERSFGLRERAFASDEQDRQEGREREERQRKATAELFASPDVGNDAVSAYLGKNGDPVLASAYLKLGDRKRKQIGRVNEKLSNLLVAVERAPPAQRPMLYRAVLAEAQRDSDLKDTDEVKEMPPDYPGQAQTRMWAIGLMSSEHARNLFEPDKAPSGFRPGADGTLEEIPGGPADPSYLGRRAAATREPEKPSQFETLLNKAGIQGDERTRLFKARAEDLAGLGGEDAKAQSSIGKLNADLEANRITPGQHKAATKKALNSEPPETIARSILLPIYKKVVDGGTPTKGEQAVLDLAMKMDPIRGAIRNALGAAGLLSGSRPEGPAAESLTAGLPAPRAPAPQGAAAPTKVPPPGQRVVGQVYPTPTGPARWTGQGWAMIQGQ